MTVIGAKKIQGKWTLFSDDIITQGDMKYSASKHYRKKIRALPRATHLTLAASAGTCRESDLLINMIDKAIGETYGDKDYTSLQLLDLLQETLVSGCKTLKEVSEDNPQYSLFILDTELNVVYFIEEFAVRILSENVECVCGSGQGLFFKFYERINNLPEDEKFRKAIIEAAVFDDGCGVPVYETNGTDFYSYDEDGKIIAEVH